MSNLEHILIGHVFPEFAEVKTMESKPADLILVKVTEWISHPIEVEKSPYSHVAIVVNNNELIETQDFMAIGYAGLDDHRGVE